MKKIEQNTVLSTDWQKSKPSCGGLNSKWQVKETRADTPSQKFWGKPGSSEGV